MVRQRRQIVRIVIHIVTRGGLGRAPVTATIMRDNAKAVIQKEHHIVAYDADNRPRYVVVWDLQWAVVYCQRLEPATDLSRPMTASD